MRFIRCDGHFQTVGAGGSGSRRRVSENGSLAAGFFFVSLFFLSHILYFATINRYIVIQIASHAGRARRRDIGDAAIRDFRAVLERRIIRKIYIGRDFAPKKDLGETPPGHVSPPRVARASSRTLHTFLLVFSFRHAAKISSRLHESHVYYIPQGLNGTSRICSWISTCESSPWHIRLPHVEGARRFSGNISRDVSSE